MGRSIYNMFNLKVYVAKLSASYPEAPYARSLPAAILTGIITRTILRKAMASSIHRALVIIFAQTEIRFVLDTV
jgi:hypothetical protein